MGGNAVKQTKIIYYSAFVGVVYIIFGLMELIKFLGLDVIETPLTNFNPDLIAAFSLSVVGGIYIHGFLASRRGEEKSIAYPIVSTILAIGLFILYTMILLANFAEAVLLNNPDYANWTIQNDLRPEIYLIFFVLPILFWLRGMVKEGKIRLI